MNTEEIIKHCRDRAYMAGIERDQNRVKATSEIFTPTELVCKLLDELPEEYFIDQSKTFLDPSCGDGQFLSEVLIRKIENDIPFELALGSIYGVDIMSDNVDLCRERLLCGQEHLRYIVEKNIIVGDTLNPLEKIDGQSEQDHDRMKELFFRTKGEKAVNQLTSTGLFELA